MSRAIDGETVIVAAGPLGHVGVLPCGICLGQIVDWKLWQREIGDCESCPRKNSVA